PSWLQKALAEIRKGSFGAAWDALVEKWLSLEAKYGFSSPRTGLDTINRPEQYSWWIQRGREYTPDIDDINKFASGWWSWWCALQPEWRPTSPSNRPLMTGEGSWEVLMKPGRNGFLSVVMGLYWWKQKLGDDNSADWD
ncbi:hypothetical protein BD410DRAFT_683500, partial [Rickenella mellea]